MSVVVRFRIDEDIRDRLDQLGRAVDRTVVELMRGYIEDGLRDGERWQERFGSGSDGGNVPAKRPRGFAALSPEARSAMASMGGKACPAERRAYARDPELAAEAGRKGGQSFQARKREGKL